MAHFLPQETDSVVVMRRARQHAAIRLTTVGLGIVALAGCFDRSTAPPPALAPAPRHDFVGDPDWGTNNSVASGSYEGTIERVYGGAPPAATPLGPFRYPTFIIANVSGQVRQMPAALQGSGFVREAWSTNDPFFWGSMGFINTSNGDKWHAVGASAILRVVAPIAPFREPAGGQPTGDWNHCGWAGYALCWTWAGTAHFDFTRIHVDLTLTQSPDTTIWQGSAATFTAGMSQTNFPGNPYPVDMSELQWRWLPDSVGIDTTACHSFSGRTCTHVFTSSGTIYAAAYVNGEAQQKSMHVVVSVPRLDVTATPGRLPYPGDSVTAVTTANGPLVVQGWSFTPESGGGTSPPPVAAGSSWGSCVAGVVTCRNLVTRSGTISVIGTVRGAPLTASAHVTLLAPPNFTLEADRPTIVAGDTETFTPQSGGVAIPADRWRWVPDSAIAGDATGCVSGTTTCRKRMVVSGTMWAYVGQDSASAHVTVNPPTLILTASATDVHEGDTVTFTATVTPQGADYQIIGWSWDTTSAVLMASRIGLGRSSTSISIPSQPNRSTAPDSADTMFSDVGGPADPFPQIPLTQACTDNQLTCTAPVFQSGTMTVTVVAGGDTLRAKVKGQVHYECRDIYHIGLANIGPFPAVHDPSNAPDMVTAHLDPPLIFIGLYQGTDYGIPLGKYQPVSGRASNGYFLVSKTLPNGIIDRSYVVFRCHDWRTQRPDGSDWWRGSDKPDYAGHHNLHFVPFPP